MTVILPMNAYGQQADCDSLSVKNRGLGNYEFKWRQTILPASLIGAGAVALAPGFIRNGSRDITNNVIDIRGSNNRLEFDDYIQYLPVAGSLMLGCAGIKAKHPFRDRFLLLLLPMRHWQFLQMFRNSALMRKGRSLQVTTLSLQDILQQLSWVLNLCGWNTVVGMESVLIPSQLG